MNRVKLLFLLTLLPLLVSAQAKRTIHVEIADTLHDLISDEEKYEIEELTLTGRINGTDIILLRDMAGIKYDYHIYSKSGGKLKKLDLSEVTIVSGGYSYEIKINGDWEEIVTNDNCLSQYVFNYSELSEIVIPNNVTSIGDCAFFGCNLTSINIPNSVTSIGEDAFRCSGSLTSIKVEDDNPKYDSRNNCNAIIDSNNQLILGCKNTTSNFRHRIKFMPRASSQSQR